MSNKIDSNEKPELLNSIIGLIDQTRHFVAKTVNQELTLLYWKIGKTINEEILKNDRADYGKKLIQNLSEELSNRYGTGFNKRNLHSFIKLNSVFQDLTIVHTVCAQLSWSHLYTILKVLAYLTQLPEKQLLLEKLERAIAIAENNIHKINE